MIVKIKRILFLVIFIFCCVWCIKILVYDVNIGGNGRFVEGIISFDAGEFVEDVISLNNKYTLRAYLIDGGPISGDGIRVILIDNFNNKSKIIYNGYPERTVDMKWLDNDNVIINGKKLNIHNDIYEWRIHK